MQGSSGTMCFTSALLSGVEAASRLSSVPKRMRRYRARTMRWRMSFDN
jgi:hypothetical protein